jgi:hypothetical protein
MGTRVNLHAANAGLAYFGMVFAADFALGVLRVFFVTPRLGETVAVLFELPVMLALSWLACRWLITGLDVSPRVTTRLIMGGLAFAILMAAEFAISKIAFGRSLWDHLDHFCELPALLGLAVAVALAMITPSGSTPIDRLAAQRLMSTTMGT